MLILSTLTASLVASSTPLHVELDIYSNKAFFNKTYSLSNEGSISTKVPLETKIQSVRYALPKKCNITSSVIEKLDNKELSDKKTEIMLGIKALEAKEQLLKTLSLHDVKNSTEIEPITNLLVENLTQNSLKIKNLQDELEELDKELKKATQNLKITYTCKVEDEKLKITYPQKGIKYTPFYDISANVNNLSLDIEKKATLFYRGAEDYENADLNIYSYRYNQNTSPQRFYPKYLGQQKNIRSANKMMLTDSIQTETSNTPKSQHKNLTTKSVYTVTGVALKSGETNLVHIDKETVDASFKSTIDAYGSNKAYLEATFKTSKNYSDAQANFFLDQSPISTRYTKRIQKNRETKLYFGEDEHIVIKKELIKTLDEKAFFGDKKVSTQNWKYTITNEKPYSTNIEFITRVPVSKDGDIKVKTLAQPKFDTQSAEGKTVWNFRLDPMRNKNIIFGFEIMDSK